MIESAISSPDAAVDPHAPHLFDPATMRQRLDRARRQGPADFLLRRVAAELADRLGSVNRRFSRVLDWATPGSLIAQSLSAAELKVRGTPLPDTEASGWLSATVDPELLPFGPGAFDLVVSGLALQTVNDLPGTLRQIRIALAPDGLFLGCLLGGRSLSELRAAWTEAEIEVRGGASPRIVPFVDLRDLGALLQRAGFALPVTDVDTVTVRYASMFGLVADLRAMGATNALAARDRRMLPRQIAFRAAEIYAERFGAPDGRVSATFELVWLSGWAPHDSQQKPLRPGSAKVRLADALNAREIRLPEHD